SPSSSERRGQCKSSAIPLALFASSSSPPDIGHPFHHAITTLDGLRLIEEPPPLVRRAVREVETAGIEPASAVARKGASTSVAGTLISASTRLAGGVVGGQLQSCPRRGWSGPHRVSPLCEPDRHRGRMTAG